MPSVCGVDLAAGVGGGGVAVQLAEPSSNRIELSFAGGWELVVPAEHRVAILRGCGLKDYVPVRNSVLPVLEQGLDLLAVEETALLRTVGATQDHIVWWPGPDGLVIEWVGSHGWRSDLRAGGVARDRQGNIVRSTPVQAVAVHHSFMHFRRSELGKDLANAFRETWLAMENLLDDIHPYESGSEGDWLVAALEKADQMVQLPFATDGGVSRPQAAKRAWYDSYRRRFFHAKSSRAKNDLVPPGPVLHEVRDELEAARAEIRNYYLEVLRRRYNLQRGGGGLTYLGFQSGMDTIESMGLRLKVVGSAIKPSAGEAGLAVVSHRDRPWSRTFTARHLPRDADPVTHLVLTAGGEDFYLSDLEVTACTDDAAEVRGRMRFYLEPNVGQRTTS